METASIKSEAFESIPEGPTAVCLAKLCSCASCNAAALGQANKPVTVGELARIVRDVQRETFEATGPRSYLAREVADVRSESIDNEIRQARIGGDLVACAIATVAALAAIYVIWETVQDLDRRALALEDALRRLSAN